MGNRRRVKIKAHLILEGGEVVNGHVREAWVRDGEALMRFVGTFTDHEGERCDVEAVDTKDEIKFGHRKL